MGVTGTDQTVPTQIRACDWSMLFAFALLCNTLTHFVIGLRDSGPCVVKKWRFGRPVPSVETTFTRPNPVGDVTMTMTKWRVDTSVLSLRHTKQAIWTAVWFVFHDTGA